jgi:hypothetical protein
MLWNLHNSCCEQLFYENWVGSAIQIKAGRISHFDSKKESVAEFVVLDTLVVTENRVVWHNLRLAENVQ